MWPVVFCCSCGQPPIRPEWKDQPLIFQTHPNMSRGFVSVEQDGQTVTLTADCGAADSGISEGMKQIDIQRLSSICIVTDGRQDLRVGPVDIERPGTHLYTAFSARSNKPGRVSLGVYKDGRLLDGLLKVVEPGKEWTRYRFILRVYQPVNEITLRIQTDATVEIEDFGSLCKKPVASAETKL